MSTTQQLLADPSKEKTDTILKGKCPICKENLYMQIAFTHRHVEWQEHGFVKETVFAKKTIDGWMTYKRDWNYVYKDHFLYLGDFVFIEEESPEWQHKLHILNQYNDHVRSVHQWLNESIHKFTQNHETLKVKFINTKEEGEVHINWNVGICNHEEMTQIINDFYHAYYGTPTKCATYNLIKKWWKPSSDDWSYWIPAFREWFYKANDIWWDDITQVSETKHYTVFIDRKKERDKLKKGYSLQRSIDILSVKSSMSDIFTKCNKRIWRLANQDDKKEYRSKKKSERLLLSYLTHDEKIELKNCRRLTVKSKIYHNTEYEIQIGHHGVIEVYYKGNNTEALCLQLDQDMPIGDEILVKYLACKFDEEALRKRAVVLERGN